MLSLEVFNAGFEAIALRYNREQILENDLLVDIYRDTLKNLSDRAFMLGIKKVIQNEAFFPSANKILEYAGFDAERAPGENTLGIIGETTQLSLPSHQLRMTPEEIKLLGTQGRLIGRIIVNTAGMMSVSEKEALIDQLKGKEIHELEAIVSTAEKTRVLSKARSRHSEWAGVKEITRSLKQELENRVSI